MPDHSPLGQILKHGPLIPVIAIENADDAVPLARALVAGGVRLLEVTLRTDAAADAIRRIVGEVPDAIVGVGTIRTPHDVDLAKRLGARFLISPGATADLYKAAGASGLPFLPGVATASEVLSALEAGCQVMKFFPAAEAGGMAMLKAFYGPFSHVRFCPTGGVGEANCKDWLALPNVVAVGGSWLAPMSLIKAKAWGEITAIAQRSTRAL